uniref:C-X-C motif chemokine 11-like n=1 Tax=Sinocyclocheilus rhinocerous TaxID=307959 RepID=A0A673LT97_9TELE
MGTKTKGKALILQYLNELLKSFSHNLTDPDITQAQFIENMKTMKTIAAFVLLACLIAVGVKGQDRSSKGRCFCADKGANMVLVRNIEKVEIIPPSPSCRKHEIIVTLKNGAGRKCMNPESKFTQNVIIKAIEKR